MEFTPRLKAPAKNNKYYNNTSAGGYLHNILGNYPYNAGDSRTGLPGLNVLTNCVGWACGRFAEISNKKKLIYDFNTDAKNFPAVAKQLGLKTGKTPKVGAIIVWSNSSYGHVAVVEQVVSDTEIVVSQSGWSYKGSTGMWTATHTKGKNGNWIEGGDYSWMNGRYTFNCFIYHPDFEGDSSSSKSSNSSATSTTTATKDDGYTVETRTAKLNTSTKAYKINVIDVKSKHYIKLRDLDEVLGICKVGYSNKKVTINGNPIDIEKFDIINKDSTYYMNVTNISRKLNLCNVTYTTLSRVFTFKVKS